MGTPCAPTVANLYLAFFEARYIERSHLWHREIIILRRYIDDMLLIWQPGEHSFSEFLQFLSHQTGITWIPEQLSYSVDFLDLTICNDSGTLVTKTYQKPLNLYLYTPFSSSHPPHTLTGLIKGSLLKYKEQNSNLSDFSAICQLFYDRLVARGYFPRTLDTIFQPLLTSINGEFPQLTSKAQTRDIDAFYFFKTTYNPNGGSSHDIYRILNLPFLQILLSRHGLGRVLICFRKSSSLFNLLCRTEITIAPEDISPTTLLQLGDPGASNPNPFQ